MYSSAVFLSILSIFLALSITTAALPSPIADSNDLAGFTLADINARAVQKDCSCCNSPLLHVNPAGWCGCDCSKTHERHKYQKKPPPKRNVDSAEIDAGVMHEEVKRNADIADVDARPVHEDVKRDADVAKIDARAVQKDCSCCSSPLLHVNPAGWCGCDCSKPHPKSESRHKTPGKRNADIADINARAMQDTEPHKKAQEDHHKKAHHKKMPTAPFKRNAEVADIDARDVMQGTEPQEKAPPMQGSQPPKKTHHKKKPKPAVKRNADFADIDAGAVA